MTAIRFHTLALITCFAMGCSVKTDCEKVVDHIIMVVSKDPAVTEEKKSGLTTYKSRKILLEQCYENFRPDGGIECALAAKTLQEVNACQTKMQPEKKD